MTEVTESKPERDASQSEEDALQPERDASQSEEDASQSKENESEEDESQSEEDASQSEEDESQSEEDESQSEEDVLQKERAELKNDKKSLKCEIDAFKLEKDAFQLEKYVLQRERTELQNDKESLKCEIDAFQLEKHALFNYFSFFNNQVFWEDSFSDLTVKFGDSEYRLHRIVLARCSRVLHMKLLNSKIAADKPLLLDEITLLTKQEFEKLMKFMYNGEIELTSEWEMWLFLLVASMYQMCTLLKICTNKILKINDRKESKFINRIYPLPLKNNDGSNAQSENHEDSDEYKVLLQFKKKNTLTNLESILSNKFGSQCNISEFVITDCKISTINRNDFTFNVAVLPKSSMRYTFENNKSLEQIIPKVDKEKMPHIIGITETEFPEKINESSYNEFSNRDTHNAAIYVRKYLPTEKVNVDEKPYVEHVWCRVTPNDLHNINVLIGCIYRPPDSLIEVDQQIIKLLHAASDFAKNNECDLWIMGDFNYSKIKWDTKDKVSNKSREGRFLDALQNENLFQHVKDPQYTYGKNILDLIITKNQNIENLNVKENIFDKDDHKSLTFEVCKNQCMYMNVNGLNDQVKKGKKKNKLTILNKYADTNKPFFMAFTETKSKKNKSYEINNYIEYRRDRPGNGGAGGGVAIYIKEEYTSEQVKIDIEHVWCAVHLPMNNETLLVGCIYRPPESFFNWEKKCKNLLKKAKKYMESKKYNYYLIMSNLDLCDQKIFNGKISGRTNVITNYNIQSVSVKLNTNTSPKSENNLSDSGFPATEE